MNTYCVNFNVHGTCEIKANSSEEAEDIFNCLPNEEKIKLVSEEICNSGIEVGTIEIL